MKKIILTEQQIDNINNDSENGLMIQKRNKEDKSDTDIRKVLRDSALILLKNDEGIHNRYDLITKLKELTAYYASAIIDDPKIKRIIRDREEKLNAKRVNRPDPEKERIDKIFSDYERLYKH